MKLKTQITEISVIETEVDLPFCSKTALHFYAVLSENVAMEIFGANDDGGFRMLIIDDAAKVLNRASKGEVITAEEFNANLQAFINQTKIA